MSRARCMSKDLFVGIDGCRGGWLAVHWDGTAESFPVVHFLSNIDELKLSTIRVCAVDIPIGFMDVAVPGGRDAEKLARKFLKGKSSSVFSSPSRKALEAKDFEEALSINIKNSHPPGIGLSRQSAALIPKMSEVDRFMSPEIQDQIFETHPELAFAIMNGNLAVQSKKRRMIGRKERLELLLGNGFPSDKLLIPANTPRIWSQDDLLDACACAWSARRIAEGRAVSFPADPPLDARGLRMAIHA
jgi:predicted RNase H-like nuclease